MGLIKMIFRLKTRKICKKESCIQDNGACQRNAEKVKELKFGQMDRNMMDILKMIRLQVMVD